MNELLSHSSPRSEVIEKADVDAVKDAGILTAAQAVEHYEIARYGALIAWAKLLGHEDAAAFLDKGLACSVERHVRHSAEAGNEAFDRLNENDSNRD